ncbi:ABC-type Fe3+ transport system, periplasmic component [Hahella chejuensis KCTC 2396]|uniref:ABC-type Fe3+ transport system, periplasmic component n=1 Tax=Hahella chejuensis (strain KCTC 2396) TaxID=349521 RepID=Q2SDS5_HAHCH|nr:Fe(3+) ABC transporter substrate-binding protein [Hahella chejuensis]ABC31199.1 ABC-type Fe3+ transport system, periplasmic component [Hahella chejuensis KCTC 2396]
MPKKTASVFKAALLSTFCLTPLAAQAAEEVNVYSYRQEFLIQPLLDTFTSQTNIKVNVVFAKEGVAERLKREGANSPADLVLSTDIGQLQELTDAKVLQPVKSDVLNANIPEQYQAQDDSWFGLTARARVIYASKERTEVKSISYEDLAKPEWKGRICTRSGKHPYNIALFASMIAHHGEAKTEEWLRGLKENLARKPQGNDRAQVKAIKDGICDVSLGNSYYYGLMLTDENQIEWARAVNLIFPNQNDRGSHVNISGVALTKSSPNKANAIKLMEFLTEKLAQKMYSENNYEYPIKPGVEPSGLVLSWGEFKRDELPLYKAGELREKAVKMVDKVDFDG